MHAGLSEPVLDVGRTVVGYPDVLALMRELKAIGAHNVTAGRARGLTGRKRLIAMTQAYETLRQGGKLPATYEVIHAIRDSIYRSGNKKLQPEPRSLLIIFAR